MSSDSLHEGYLCMQGAPNPIPLLSLLRFVIVVGAVAAVTAAVVGAVVLITDANGQPPQLLLLLLLPLLLVVLAKLVSYCQVGQGWGRSTVEEGLARKRRAWVHSV